MADRDRTITGALRRRVEKRPDQPYVKCGGDWITYGDLDEQSDRMAAGLAALGVQPGDRLAVLLPNREEHLPLFFGAAKAGAIIVPLNAWLKGEFLRYQMADCGASVLVTDGPGLSSAAPLLDLTAIDRLVLLDGVEHDGPAATTPWAEVAAADGKPPAIEPVTTDLASLIYTSGTTGLPKGCMLTHGYYCSGPWTMLQSGWTHPGDRILTPFPLFHTSGQVISLMAAMLADGSVCFEPQFSATEFMTRAVEEHATVLVGVGFMGMAILATQPADTDRAHRVDRAIWVPMAPQAQIQFEERFGVRVLNEAFGQTECFPISMLPADAPGLRYSLGPPTPHYEIKLFDDDDNEVPAGQPGEICVRPTEPGVMYSGYWNKSDATVAAWRNLWHHTGDMARKDDEGRLLFVDRKKDAIRRRGENVSSLELEAAIVQHPGIAAVACCAVSSSVSEDDIKAVVVAAPDTTLEPAELFEFFKAKLPYYAIPRYVHVRDALPVNALGRIMKHVMRDEGVPEGTWDFEALGFTVTRDERRGS